MGTKALEMQGLPPLNGENGIRTHGTGLSPYTGLANRIISACNNHNTINLRFRVSMPSAPGLQFFGVFLGVSDES